jgi:hypothetical protein
LVRGSGVSSDIIRKIQSTYLRNELRYDKWGAQGKLLVAEEVLAREGMVATHRRVQNLVKIAFPRTFSCQHARTAAEHLPDRKEVILYFKEIRTMFNLQGMNAHLVELLALEETAERFCITVDVVSEYSVDSK